MAEDEHVAVGDEHAGAAEPDGEVGTGVADLRECAPVVTSRSTPESGPGEKDTAGPDRELPPWLDRFLRWIDPEKNPAATVYGTFAVGLLLAAEDPARETYLRVITATLLSVAGYWLAHSYAVWLGRRFGRSSADGSTSHQLVSFGRVLAREFPLVEGALAPVAVLLGVWVLGVRLTDAVVAGIWTAAVVVLAVELAAGIRRRLPFPQLLANALVGALLAAALFGVKSVLH